MEDFDKGAKRKCTSCSTLFFDFGKSPIICPNCGVTVSTLLTNVSKRGRPPKVNKDDNQKPKSFENVVGLEEEDNVNSEVDVNDNVDIELDESEDSVEDVIEIKRDEDS
jgi:hypothetical protein